MKIVSIFLLTFAFSAQAVVIDYTYTPLNEVSLTPPTATGDPTCAGASAEGGATDEYIIRDNAGLAELEDVNYEKFFLCPGDYTGATTPDITRDCTEGTPCWLVYYSTTDPGTHPGTWDWDSADRTHLPRIDITGASWWRFVRVQWGKFNPTYTPDAAIPKDGATGTVLIGRCTRPGGTSTDIIFDQIVCEGFINHGMGSLSTGDNDRITIQRSVIRHRQIRDDTDAHCINIFDSDDFHVVSNEIFDCTDGVQIENQTSLGAIIENNDFYISQRLWADCASDPSAPEQDDNGQCACWENFIDLKDVGDSIASPVTLISGNRFQSGRKPLENGVTCGATGGDGEQIVKSNAGLDAWRVRIVNNMSWDYINTGGSANNAAFWSNVNGVSRNFSVVGNLIDNSGAPGRSVMRPGFQDSEIYLNTVIGGVEWTRYNTGVDDQSTEALCNTLINVDDGFGGATPPAGSKIGYNAFIASGAEEEFGFAGSNYENASLAAMNFDDLRIEHKLITTAPETYTFIDVVPSATTPAAYLDLCPGTGDTDTMGERADMGIDDVEADWP
jgi:hypothetical protein